MVSPTEKLNRPVLAPIVAGVSILLLVAALVWSGVQTRRLADKGAATHAAVCALRQDVKQRQASSEAFLRLSPRARVEKYGQLGRIPDATIRQGIVNAQHTLDALSALRC